MSLFDLDKGILRPEEYTSGIDEATMVHSKTGPKIFTWSDNRYYRSFVKANFSKRLVGTYRDVYVYTGTYRRSAYGRDEAYDSMNLQHQGWGKSVGYLAPTFLGIGASQMTEGITKSFVVLTDAVTSVFDVGPVSVADMLSHGVGSFWRRGFLTFTTLPPTSNHASGIRGADSPTLINHFAPRQSFTIGQVCK
jgi:hypothetical protein